MKLEYKKRIYWLLRFILIVCVVNVLTGMYEVFTSNYNVTANQIIWRGARYNWDRNIYRNIDEIENLSELPKECDIRDIWAVASYYAKDDAECESRLIELENIYNDQGEKQVIENILEHDLGDDKKTRMEYLIVAGILTKDLDKGTELLNTALNYCFDRDLGVLGYKRYIDIGDKLYRKNEKVEEIIKAFEILSKYTIDRAIAIPEPKDEDEGAVETGYYHGMIQLFQTFSSMSYFADDLLLERSYPHGDNRKYIVRATIKEDYDIVLSYKKYKSFINLGNISIYGKYKNLNMIVQYTGFGYLDYRDIEENIAFRSIAIRKVYDKLFEIDIMSDHFGLRSTYVLIYDTDMNTIEGFSYGIYPGFILFNETNTDTPEAIRNFNSNFSKGGYFGEFANEVGYDENDPLTLENFGERMDEIWDMNKKTLKVLEKDYNISMEMIVKDLSGEEPLKRKE